VGKLLPAQGLCKLALIANRGVRERIVDALVASFEKT
jgi:hypothetical protein